MKTIQLNNGIVIPTPGLGTYRLGRNDEEVVRAVRSALDIGYRHIDTAMFYNNEKPIGKAIRESGISREEIFVTTKLWGTDVVSNNVEKAFEQSLQNLDIGYVDLYLVHWPVRGEVTSVWNKMEQFYSSGKTKAIGVSNHLIHHLNEILSMDSVVPAVNQIELHPYLVMQEPVDYCKHKGILVESWSPLGSSKIPLFEDPVLQKVAEEKGKSVAQIILRWNLQKGQLPLPKSSNPVRQHENLTLFDFSLSDDEMSAIDNLNKDHRTGIHPDDIEF